jgi:hypothetical protein
VPFSVAFSSHFFPLKTQMSGTTTTITISLNETSARKVFSHVLSHPHADVSGALLCGAVSSSSSQNNNNNNREIVDAMPLFHCESIDCAAMNEIALTQVQKYAKTREMRICGVYFASGNFNNTNSSGNVNSDGSGDLLPDRAKGLADAIGKAASSEGGGGGEVDEVQCLLLDAGKLKPFLDATLDSKNDEQTTVVVAAPFRVFSGSNYSNNGGELKRRANAVVRCCSNALPSSSERREPVYDFDDHFDDIGKDWRNNTKEA